MLETYSLEQIRAAMNAHLEVLQESEMELADAIRACCRSLPSSLPLRVAGHVIRWEKAQCIVHGSSMAQDFDTWHVARILLVDGWMTPEPLVEKSGTLLNGTTTFLVDFQQTDKAWFLARTYQEFQRQSDNYEDDGGEWVPLKPAPLSTCKSATLREIAPHLAQVMAAWQVEYHARLAAEAVENRRMSELLG